MKLLLDFIKQTFSDSEKIFSFYVILVLSLVTIPIIIKEAFTKEIKYYKVNVPNFPFDEVASYHISLLSTFLIFLLLIFSARLLNILTELLYLLVPYIAKKLGIEQKLKSSPEPFNPSEDIIK